MQYPSCLTSPIKHPKRLALNACFIVKYYLTDSKWRSISVRKVYNSHYILSLSGRPTVVANLSFGQFCCRIVPNVILATERTVRSNFASLPQAFQPLKLQMMVQYKQKQKRLLIYYEMIINLYVSMKDGKIKTKSSTSSP